MSVFLCLKLVFHKKFSLTVPQCVYLLLTSPSVTSISYFSISTVYMACMSHTTYDMRLADVLLNVAHIDDIVNVTETL